MKDKCPQCYSLEFGDDNGKCSYCGYGQQTKKKNFENIPTDAIKKISGQINTRNTKSDNWIGMFLVLTFLIISGIGWYVLTPSKEEHDKRIEDLNKRRQESIDYHNRLDREKQQRYANLMNLLQVGSKFDTEIWKEFFYVKKDAETDSIITYGLWGTDKVYGPAIYVYTRKNTIISWKSNNQIK